MSNSKSEQIEALKVLGDFQDKFIANTEILISELKTSRKDDTDKLLNSVTDALNWEIGVLNGTLSFINEKEQLLSRDEINAAVTALAEALQTKEDMAIANALEDKLLPVLKKVKSVVEGIG